MERLTINYADVVVNDPRTGEPQFRIPFSDRLGILDLHEALREIGEPQAAHRLWDGLIYFENPRATWNVYARAIGLPQQPVREVPPDVVRALRSLGSERALFREAFPDASQSLPSRSESSS